MASEPDKTTPYFSHDSNARSDDKILPMRMKYGWNGYGIFWALIEMLRESSGYKMRLQCDCIAYELRTDSETISSIICDYGLFIIENGFFWSESLLQRMSIMDAKKVSKSLNGSKAANKRWGNQPLNANALQSHYECNASAMQNDTKIKENKIKEKEIKDIHKAPEWKTDFSKYEQLCKDAVNEILLSDKHKKDIMVLYPDCDLKKSLQKSIMYWTSPERWEKQKKKKGINMVSTFKNNINFSMIKTIGSNEFDPYRGVVAK